MENPVEKMIIPQTRPTVNRKIPGVLPPPPKTEIDGKLSDLSSKTISELLELRDRQLKLLNNHAFIARLPDKGAKIEACYEKIVSELKGKQEEEQTCKLFNQLQINLTDKQAVQNIEWKGKLDDAKETYLDSDDDSEPEDVLHILSQSTVQEKKLIVMEPEKPLITPADLTQIEEIPHVKYIVEKTETKAKPKVAGQFKPFKTTKTDVHNPDKEILRKKHKHWEVTAATPPPTVHGPAKVLNLEESLKLQKEYNFHIKELGAQHAAERLRARLGVKMADMPEDTSKFGKYREGNDGSESSDLEGSDKEVHDEEDERGGVVFTVMK